MQTAESHPCPQRRGTSADRSRSRPAAPGRYDRLRDVRVPSEGTASVPKPQRGAVQIGAVADPLPTRTADPRLQVAINRRVDVLEEELANHRISQAAYLTGRHVQALLERLSCCSPTSLDGSSRGDPVLARENRHKALITTVKEVEKLEAQIIGRIGMLDWRLLRRVIGDNMSFADCAAKQGKSGDWGRRFVAMRFRDALEDLAEAMASRGKGRPTPDDGYRTAATAAPSRQAEAMRGGVTRERYEAELREATAALARATSMRDKGRLQETIADLEIRIAGFPTPA